MPTFSFKALNSTGKVETGYLEGASEAAVFDVLAARGLSVYELEVRSSTSNRTPWYLREISFSGVELPFGQQAVIVEQMAVMFDAGLTAIEIIRVLENSAKTTALRSHFERTRLSMEEGRPLAEAFESSSKMFSAVLIATLKVSGDTNIYHRTLADAATYLSRQAKVRGRLGSAMIYPGILILAALGLLGVMIFYLAPSLVPMFTSQDRPIPATLKIFLWFQIVLTTYRLLISTCIIILIVTLFATLRSQNITNRLRRLITKLPFIGWLLMTADFQKLVQSLGLMLDSGISLSSAFRQTGSIFSDNLYAKVFVEAADRLERGEKSSEALTGVRGISATYSDMFRIGENSNRLPIVLASVSKLLERSFDERIDRFMILLTPIMTLVIGGGIGFLVYSIMTTILDINELAI